MVKGDYVQAEKLIHEALEITRKIKNYWAEANSYAVHANFALAQGKYEDATRSAEKTLARYRELNYIQGIDIPLETLQQIDWSQGKFAESIQYGQEIIASVTGWNVIGHKTYLYLGRAVLSLGNLSQAESYLKQALPAILVKKMGFRLTDLTPHLIGWIALFTKQGKGPASARLIGAVDSTFQQIAPGLIPRERSEYAENCASTRAALGEEGFAAGYAAGKAMTLEEALAWVNENPPLPPLSKGG